MFALKPFRLIVAAAVGFALFSGSASAQAADTMKFHGAAAREIKRSIDGGEGWCIVSQRKKIKLIDELPEADCVKYRVVTKLTHSRGLDPSGIEDDVAVVELGKETDWIIVELGLPTKSGPSLAAAKRANEVIKEMDEALPILEAEIAKENDAQVQALGRKIVGVIKTQRAALAGLIQEDVKALGMLSK